MVYRMKKLGLIFLLSFHQLSCAAVCYPTIDSRLPQYIIGYGSLIDEQSKKRTDSTAQESFPVFDSALTRINQIMKLETEPHYPEKTNSFHEQKDITFDIKHLSFAYEPNTSILTDVNYIVCHFSGSREYIRK